MRPRTQRLLPALIAAAAALFITAACGGSDGGDGSDATQAGTGQNAMNGYIECMNKNGVPMTMPTGRPAGMRSGQPGVRPSGAPGNFPSGRPTAWPSGRPTAWPSGRPGSRPSGGSGAGRVQAFAKPDGVDDAVWQKALDACRSLLPSFAPGGGDRPGGQRSGSGSLSAYQNCLKDHGVKKPDQPDSTDPSLAPAAQACKVLSPAPAS